MTVLLLLTTRVNKAGHFSQQAPPGTVTAHSQHGQTAEVIIRTIPVTTPVLENQPREHLEGTSLKSKATVPPLTSMASLRGPQVRSNRVDVLHSTSNPPQINAPTNLRYPHHSKRWNQGVDKCPGESTLERVFAIRKDVEMVFKPGQLLCPFRGHSQSTRPTNLNNHAWAHNGIPEGSPDYRYNNAYHNTESLARWVRMAVHEDLATGFEKYLHLKAGG
jgi:hypothetical protein